MPQKRRSRGTQLPARGRARNAKFLAGAPVAQAIADALNPNKAHMPLPVATDLILTSEESAKLKKPKSLHGRRGPYRHQRRVPSNPAADWVPFTADNRVRSSRYRGWTMEDVAAASPTYLTFLAGLPGATAEQRKAARRALIVARARQGR